MLSSTRALNQATPNLIQLPLSFQKIGKPGTVPLSDSDAPVVVVLPLSSFQRAIIEERIHDFSSAWFIVSEQSWVGFSPVSARENPGGLASGRRSGYLGVTLRTVTQCATPCGERALFEM